jgi:protein-S-isoprenylcysteine O-methyltransferase Ste14
MLVRILIYLSYLFVGSELILTFTKRSKLKSVKKKGDRGSLVIIWIIITISIFAGFYLANFRPWSGINYAIYSIGIAVFLSGLFIRWATIIQLKKAFTVDVAINQEHALKTDGIFKMVRHPSYLGVVMIVSGLAIGMNSFYSILVIAIPVFLAILYRIRVEEAVLLEEFGEDYRKYMKTTRKIIPYLY